MSELSDGGAGDSLLYTDINISSLVDAASWQLITLVLGALA